MKDDEKEEDEALQRPVLCVSFHVMQCDYFWSTHYGDFDDAINEDAINEDDAQEAIEDDD